MVMVLAIAALFLIDSNSKPEAVQRPAPANTAEGPLTMLPQGLFKPAADLFQIKAEELMLARHVTTVFPGNAQAWTLLGTVFYQHGDIPQAREAWMQGLAHDPRNANLHLRLGIACADLGELEEALTHWQQVVAIAPRMPEVRWRMAGVCIEQGHHERAVKLLEQECELSPGMSRNTFLLAQTHLQLKDYVQARRYLEETLALDPEHYNAHYGLGTVALRLQERDEAQSHMERFTRLKEAQKNQARHRIAIDELPEAQRRMARRYGEAAQLYKLERTGAVAEALLKRAIQLDPRNTACHEQLGLYYYSRQRLPEALAEFEQARAVDPNNVLFYLNCGKVCLALKRLPQAEQVLSQAVTRFPTNSHAHAELARFYLRTQPQNVRALDLARKAVQYEASAPHYHLLAWASDVQGQPEAALQAINRAVALAPTHQTYRVLQRRLEQKVLSHAN